MNGRVEHRDKDGLNLNRLVVIVLFAALLAMAVRTPADTDMWWHLGTGRAIVTTGRIPYADEFSFTVRGQPWVNVQWLAQVGMYGAYRIGGDVLLALLVAGLVVVAFAFVYPQMEGHSFLRAFTLVLAATASAIIWSPRPQMLSFALLGVTSYLVYLFKWKQINRLWVLIPVFALWGNVHGGYALGLILIGCILVGEVLNRVTGRGALPEVLTWREIGLLTGAGILCGLALLVNPYGFGTWALPFRTVGIKTLQGFIQEWASPDFHNLYEQPVLWLLMALLVLVGFSRRQWDWSDLVVTVVFGYSAFLARRNIAPFALVIAPVLTRQAWPVIESVLTQIKLPVSARQELNPALSAVLNGLIVLMVIAFALVLCVVKLSPRAISLAQRQAAPVRAVEWLKQADRRLVGPMYNSYNWGGYLVWALPEEPVFVDGRTDVYNDVFLRDYVQVMFVRPGWQDTLNRYGVRLALTERDSVLATMLSTQPDWRLAYDDDQAVIFVREQ
jgi:hypothetical protein